MPTPDQPDLDQTLLALLDVAKMLSASADRQHILRIIIDAARDVLDAERATVFEYDAEHEQLVATVAHDFKASASPEDSGESEPIRVRLDQGLVGEAARTRTIINVPDAYADERFNPQLDRETDFRTRSILSLPMIGLGDRLMGVLQVINKRHDAFAAQDETIAEALASQAGVAIQRARLLADRVEREKLERELQLAGTIQQRTWPEVLPRVEGYDVAAGSQPADSTGGDAYDVIGLAIRDGSWRIPEPDEPASHALLLLADAVGHGVGPALSVMQLRSLIHMGLRCGCDLQALIPHIKNQLIRDLPPGFFITAWLGQIGDPNGRLVSFSAGQAPLLHYRLNEDDVRVLKADTVPFGLDPGYDLPPPVTFTLQRGDIFLVCSDGYYEALDPAGAELGIDRVIEVVKGMKAESAERILAAARETLRTFTKDAPARDDCTAVVIKRLD